jgi:glucose-6-phosphate isomerase
MPDMPNDPACAAALDAHAGTLKSVPIAALFAADSRRSAAMIHELAGLVIDHSRRRIAPETLEHLQDWAAAADVASFLSRMASGEIVNPTEGRPATHMHMRGAALGPEEVRFRFAAEAIRSGEYALAGGRCRTILHFGIGGSDLGPRLVLEALGPIDGTTPAIRFAASADPTDTALAMQGLDPRTTLLMIATKSFSTSETLNAARKARAWLEAELGVEEASRQIVAVTSNPAAAARFGIEEDLIFTMPESVGGRYSVWSAVGMSLVAALGLEVFDRFCAGARAVDDAALTLPFGRNPVLVTAAIEAFEHRHMGVRSRALFAYSRRLRLFVSWLQQLEMESLGKGVDLSGSPIPVGSQTIWGGEGTNAQHAVFQALHQGPAVQPVEFILPLADADSDTFEKRSLIANALAQAEALLVGRDIVACTDEVTRRGLDQTLAAHLVCPGDRPSTVTAMAELTPYSLGALLSFHENRVAAMGRLLGLNPFDQWGVELGKVLAVNAEKALAGEAHDALHPATKALMARLGLEG